MNRRYGLLIAVALIIAAFATWWLVLRGESPPDTATASRGSIDVTIQTVGTLQVRDQLIARAAKGGVIQQIGARAGDHVAAGDILVLLDPGPFDDAVEAAQAELEAAEFTLQFAERRLEANSADDAARTDALAASERVQTAQDALQRAKDAMADSIVIAPADGIVLEVSARVGDSVVANQPVARLMRPADLQLIADVDELDLPNVQRGATVRFRPDAFPSTEITGSVVSTAPEAHQQGGTTVFSATVSFTPPPEVDLRPGMNADVTIVTAAREGVLLIPERALKTVGDRAFVTVRDDGHQEEREVTLGYRGNGQVEIVQGLSEGERVVLH